MPQQTSVVMGICVHVCVLGWGSIRLLDDLWRQMWIFWPKEKQTVPQLSTKSPPSFFSFFFFVIFGQISAYKVTGTVWFNAVKNEQGFKFASFLTLLNLSTENLLFFLNDSCRFFNIFILLFQGLQILQFTLPSMPWKQSICSLVCFFFTPRFNIIFWN